MLIENNGFFKRFRALLVRLGCFDLPVELERASMVLLWLYLFPRNTSYVTLLLDVPFAARLTSRPHNVESSYHTLALRQPKCPVHSVLWLTYLHAALQRPHIVCQ